MDLPGNFIVCDIRSYCSWVIRYRLRENCSNCGWSVGVHPCDNESNFKIQGETAVNAFNPDTNEMQSEPLE